MYLDLDECKGVFGLAFGAKSQTEGLDSESSFFSKSSLSQCKTESTLGPVLVAFRWKCENIYRRTFNDF
jgi:hypothetical protein